MAQHNDLGQWGEALACEYLVKQGCAICERNWRMGRYETDIVAMHGTTMVFCEVKTRSDPDSDPLDAVDERRIAHMVASANVYIESKGLEVLDIRFDLFGIRGTPALGYEMEYVPDAFEVPLTTY